MGRGRRRAEIESMIDQLGGAWDAGLSLLLDEAVIAEDGRAA